MRNRSSYLLMLLLFGCAVVTATLVGADIQDVDLVAAEAAAEAPMSPLHVEGSAELPPELQDPEWMRFDPRQRIWECTGEGYCPLNCLCLFIRNQAHCYC